MLSRVSGQNSNIYVKKTVINCSAPALSFHSALAQSEKDVYIHNLKNNVTFKADLQNDIALGSNYNPKTKDLEFGIFSKNAEKINLYIFDNPKNSDPIAVLPMEKQNNNKWVCKIDKTLQKELNLDILNKKPVYYGYRAWGPNWRYDKDWKPESGLGFISHVDCEGNRFNPNKLLTDPYAKEVTHDPVSKEFWDGTIYATGDKNYLKDSAKAAPKSIFMLFDNVDTGKKPNRSLNDDVIYEVHLKGFSKSDKSIENEEYRGTYKGAATKAKYLKELGVTMVEFLPVQEFQNYDNYWGYMTNQFFAPDRDYAYDKSPGGPTREFKNMVKAFHDEGIKVCLDVVYNHTGEGGLWQVKDEVSGKEYTDVNVTNLYSLRGLDSKSYYESSADKRYYYDNTGCGGNYNIAEDAARDLVVDSIKYWAEEMGVDAFRFDLAPVLGNIHKENGFYFCTKKKNGFFKVLREKVAIRNNANTKGVDLIAEPWAVGINNQQTEGQFPLDWKEWSGKFRDVVKNLFKNPSRTKWGDVATVICGQKDLYGGENSRAINYVACHDNVTLNDYFSNKDSYEIFNTNKLKSIRNSILTTLVSKGTPMLLGGDEILRTQNGDPNPYNKDSKEFYIDWDLHKLQKDMFNFTKRAIEFRKTHPALKDSEYFNGLDNNNNGLKDITWLDEYANEVNNAKHMCDTDKEFLGFRIDGTEFFDNAASIYTVINKGQHDTKFTLPENISGKNWYFVADTSEHSEKCGNFLPEGKELKVAKHHNISPNSMMLFIER